MHLRYFFKESTTNNNNTPSHSFKLKSDFIPPLPDNENLLEFISLVYQEIQSHSKTPTNILLYVCIYTVLYVCMRAVNREQHILYISEQKHAN